jgi:hypothetical protein
MFRAVERMKAKIRPDTVVMLFFGGYGVQVGRESYMIPVDATIWKEADVKRTGVSVESVLDAMKERGAKAKLVVLDASRRNPYERRFRAFSHGLAPISPPRTPSCCLRRRRARSPTTARAPTACWSPSCSTTSTPRAGAETAFNKTRVAISRASEGEQVPSVSSSLLEDIKLGG